MNKGAAFMILVAVLQLVAAVFYARSRQWPFALMMVGASTANVAAAWGSNV
jgi:hypothetical protein